MLVLNNFWRKIPIETQYAQLCQTNFETISQIVFSPLGLSSFSVLKGRSSWTLVSDNIPYPLFTKKLEKFIDQLQALKGLSMKEDSKISYEIATTPELVFYENNKETEAFFLGKKDLLKKEIYIQRKSDKKIFLVYDIFSDLIQEGFNSLVDHRIFPELVDRELISVITKPLSLSHNPLSIKKTLHYHLTNKGWQSDQGTIFNSFNLNSFGHLNSVEIVYIDRKLNNPIYQIDLMWANNITRTLFVYNYEDNKILLNIKDNPYIHILDISHLKRFYQNS